jgi:O-antigen/teichoic acid export membrane protein
LLQGPVASATIRTTFVLGLRLVLQAGTLLLVARVLGPSLFGAYVGIAALAILLGTLTTFGTPLVLMGEASQAFRRRLRVLPYCVSTALVCGALLFVIYLLLVNSLFGESPVSFALIVVIGLTELMVQPLMGFPSVQLQAQRRIAASQLVHLVPLGLRFLVILYLFLVPLGQPLTIFVSASLFAGLLGLLVASLALPKAWPAFRHWRLPTAPELRRAAGFAMLTATARGPTEVDKSLAASLLPLATAGVYSGAARIISAVNVPVLAMVQAALPTLFAQARQAPGIAPKMLATMYGAAFLYGSAAALLMWLFVPSIAWLFGDAYAGVGQAASLLCAAIPGTTLRMTSGTVLIARDQPWARVFYEASGVAVLLVAAICLAPRFGITGMIGAYVATEWVMAFVAAGLVARQRY